MRARLRAEFCFAADSDFRGSLPYSIRPIVAKCPSSEPFVAGIDRTSSVRIDLSSYLMVYCKLVIQKLRSKMTAFGINILTRSYSISQ